MIDFENSILRPKIKMSSATCGFACKNQRRGPQEGGCAVLSVQYGDFRAALTMGLTMGLEDALVVELDREED